MDDNYVMQNEHTEYADRSISNNASETNKPRKPKAKRILIAAIAVLLVISIAATVVIVGFAKKKSATASVDEAERSDANYISFTEGFTDILVKDEKSAVDAAASVAPALGITDASKELKVESVTKIDSSSYYRMQQYYDGIPVYGRTVVISAAEDGTATALTANTVLSEIKNTSTTITEEEACDFLSEALGGNVQCNSEGLCIYWSDDNEAVLAYNITASYSTEESSGYKEFIVSADDGKILFTNDLIRTADEKYPKSAYTYKLEDKKYVMYDKKRNIVIVDSKKKLSELAEKDDGVLIYADDGTKVEKVDYQDNLIDYPDDSKIYLDKKFSYVTSESGKWNDKPSDYMVSLEKSYDFYKDFFGLSGYDNNNGLMVATYNDFFYSKGNNAYSRNWYLCLGYEQDTSRMDLIGHEYTHSVEKNISGMKYEGESGAIMEAYSDIFGELIEDYADGKMNASCDWIHGDRNMISPMDNSYPSVYRGEHWRDTNNILDEENESTNDNGNVHTNNTVLSHAAYLMTQGNSSGDGKINTEKLAKLWFRALQHLHSDATFTQCAVNVMFEAEQMFKEGLLTIEQIEVVKEAFKKVDIFNSGASVVNGSLVFARDKNGNLYEDYHVVIEKINLENRNTKVVAEADVKDDKGYKLNLEAGYYTITVSDNKEDGSTYKFTNTVRVIENIRDLKEFRDDVAVPSFVEVQKIYIQTDFTPPIDYDNLVVDGYSEDYDFNGVPLSIRIPKINIDSPKIDKINKKIYDEVEDKFANIFNAKYEWYVNNNILTIIVDYFYYATEADGLLIYNIDVIDEKLLDTDDILYYAGVDRDEYYKRLKEALGAKIWTEDTNNSIEELIEDYKNFKVDKDRLQHVNDVLGKVLCEDNYMESKAYLNEQGELCAYTICGWIPVGADDTYSCTVNLETYTKSPYFKERIEIPERDDWKELYIDYVNSSYLLNGDVCVFYLDGDNIPELFICGRSHAEGANICWIDNGEVKAQRCGQTFGYISSEKCYTFSMQMGAGGLAEYTLSNGNLAEENIAKHSENANRYEWRGESVSAQEYWDNYDSYTGEFVSGYWHKYVPATELATALSSY